MKFKQQVSRRDELPELEITPMLNVMLVVLAFFVAVAANLAEEGQHLKVHLPQEAEALDAETADSQTSDSSEALQVALQTGGELSVNDRPIEKTQLLQQLPGYLQQSPQRHVYLRVAGDVPYQTVIETLTALQEIGGDRVSLVIGSTQDET